MPARVARSLLLVALAMSAGRVTAQGFTAPSFVRPTWTSAQSFTTIVGVRETADGSVLVADYAEPAVYLLAPGGQRARLIGRKGSGPREYLAPYRMIALPADSTLMIDAELARYLIIAPSGTIAVTARSQKSSRSRHSTHVAPIVSAASTSNLDSCQPTPPPRRLRRCSGGTGRPIGSTASARFGCPPGRR